ncbi:MAG: hypothetical protein HY526_12440 [Betaproteobacteria bacterium]|nr:hypothetical protein [Betaproteobacteria bacterium]
METTTPSRSVEMRALIGLSAEIARRGYGERVIEVALWRKGVSREVARVIAVSAVSCRSAILTAQASANAGIVPPPDAGARCDIDLRTARAARLALSKTANFVILACLGFGGGLLLGWSVGFGQGIEDGFEWIVRAIERLVGR